MNKSWPQVKLGRILRRVERFEPRNELTEYCFAGTYSFARGIFVGEQKLGSTFQLPKLQRIKEGDFVYCKIMAWEGAFGLVPREADNCVMSGAFVAYELDRRHLDEKFLDYFFKVPSHWQTIGSQSSGTNVRRQSLHPEQFERAEIPLPDLQEQRRIVMRIESLARKVEEARHIRKQSAEEADMFLSSSISHLCQSPHWKTTTVADLLNGHPLRNGKSVKPAGNFGEVRCLILSAMRNGRIDLGQSKVVPLTVAEAQPFLVKKRDVFIVRGNGSKNLCGLAGLVAEMPESVIFPDLFIHLPLPIERMLPEFFVAAWNSAATREVIEEKAKTTSGIWKINQGHILTTAIPVPSLFEQRRIVAELDSLQVRVDSLKKLQAETSTELDALMPSILDKAFQAEL